MQCPNAKDYGPFYDEAKQSTAAYDQYVRDVTKYEAVRAHARNAIHFLIAAEQEGVREDDFAEELVREHRTHQQQAARMIRLLLRAMAESEYDLRNEGMVLFARAASKATEKVALPFI